MVDLDNTQFYLNGRVFHSLDELVKNINDEELFALGDVIFEKAMAQMAIEKIERRNPRRIIKKVSGGLFLATGTALAFIAPTCIGFLKAMTMTALSTTSLVSGWRLLKTPAKPRLEKTPLDNVDFHYLYHRLEMEAMERSLGATIFPEFYEGFRKEFESYDENGESLEDDKEVELNFSIYLPNV